MTRRALCAAILAATAVPFAAIAQDAPYPTRPLTIVVPFSTGGGVDVTARLLAEKLRLSLGQTVVIENKAGGSGMIGTLAVVRAQADGHTLLLATAGETAINPHVYKAKMQYAPEKDLAPVTLVVKVPNAVVVNPKLPINSIPELLAFAKANSGKVSYGTSGIGNPQHLAGEMLEQLSGTPLTHVPYRGASNQLTDTAGGSIDMTFVSLGAARPFLKDGRVRAIAITSPKRSTLAPDLPPIAETPGLEKYSLDNWFGLFAPAKTPTAVVQKLNTAVAQALQDPDLVKRLNELGAEPAPMDPAQFKGFIQSESARFEKLVADAKITPEN
ncbi:MAG: tripartite tricarboxylate transporter substrate binding protein [Burkholderiaceae bacterium]